LQTIDNGGRIITGYKLRRDPGNLQGPIDILVGGYDGASSTYQVQGLTPGKLYRFQYYAVNAMGESAASATTTVASSALPDAPTNIVINWLISTKTSLGIEWSAPTAVPSSSITGYLLEMDDGHGGQFSRIYDGSKDNNNLHYLKTGLTTGLLYRFRAFAANYNGVSPASSIASYYVCTEPAEFAKPVVVSQTNSQIEISWEPPGDLGGCSITSYAVLRD